MKEWHDFWYQDVAAWHRELTERAATVRLTNPLAWEAAVLQWSVPPLDTVRTGMPRRPLDGVGFAVKDLFAVDGWRVTAGSRLFAHLDSAESTVGSDGYGYRAVRGAESRVVAELRALGALPVARTGMNEFAYGLDGKNPHYGSVSHPQAMGRISGGSSSGSAWAVGAGVVPLSIGTDTGGSVRVPAALCGLWGLRRPVDDWASEGVVPLARSFDTAGYFVRTGFDLAELVEALFPETRSVESRPLERVLWYQPSIVNYAAEAKEAYAKFVGSAPWDVNGLGGAAASSVAGRLQRALDALAEAILEGYNVIGSTEAYEVHQLWLDEYRDLYDPVVWALIDRGRRWPKGWIERARATEAAVGAIMDEALDVYDAVVMPVVTGVAPVQDAANAAYRQDTLRLNAPASFAHRAALSVPVRLEARPRTSRAHRGMRGALDRAFEPTVGVQVVVRDERMRAYAELSRRLANHEQVCG